MAKDPRPKFASFNDFVADGTKRKAKKDEKSLVAVKVRATRRGYYDLKLREEGDVFVAKVNAASKDRDGMLPSWVEAVDSVEIPVAPIPETQETVHLRAGDPAGDVGSAGSGSADDSDAVI